MKISLSIAHLPSSPERVASMAAVRAQLAGEPWAAYLEMTDRAPNWQWSLAMWEQAAATHADLHVFAQDDIEVCPAPFDTISAIAEAWPGQIIAFQSFHQASKPLLEEGHHGHTTSDALVGTLYALPHVELLLFLEWRRTALIEGWESVGDHGAITEDTLISLWCMVTGRKIVRPVPGIFRHRTEIASSFGNDAHQNRNPAVLWSDPPSPYPGVDFLGPNLTSAAWWRGDRPLPHLGCFFGEPMAKLALRWVKGFTEGDALRCRQDDGSPVLTGLKYRMLAKAYKEPKFKLFVGTPHRGEIRPEYAMSIFKLQRMLGIDLAHEMQFDVRQQRNDVVRVRSRMARIAYDLGSTHIVFADGDNAWEPETLIRMLQTGKDFIQCPYVRGDGKGYTIRATEKDRAAGVTAPEDVFPDGTIEIEGTGLGLTVLSRRCLERMLAAYGGKQARRLSIAEVREIVRQCDTGEISEQDAELAVATAGEGLDFFDQIDNQLYKTTALFQLMFRDNALLSEDMSFAARWRDLGEKIYLYIGPGSPVAHYKTICLAGDIEDLGFTHTKPKAAAA